MEVRDFVKGIYGKTCNLVEQGYGSFLTLEFEHSKNQRFLWFKKKEKLGTTRWKIWIYCCNWKVLNSIKGKEKEITNSEKEKIEIKESLSGVIEGQKLINISINEKTGETALQFDLGAIIRITNYEDCNDINRTILIHDDEAYENWFLYNDNNEVLTIRSDGKYCIESIADDDSKNWKNLEL